LAKALVEIPPHGVGVEQPGLTIEKPLQGGESAEVEKGLSADPPPRGEAARSDAAMQHEAACIMANYFDYLSFYCRLVVDIV